MDKITLAKIELLHPKVREEARTIYDECCAALTGNYTLRFTHTLRTFREQAALYAQGRTAPGPKVTNAKPGYSYHNYGLAIDIVLIAKDFKTVSWNTLKDFDFDGIADWQECVQIFKKYNWTWGGDFKSLKDYPHFEKTFGYSVKNLMAIRNKQKLTYLSLV